MPSAAGDDQLVGMWERAYEAYEMTLRTFDLTEQAQEGLRKRLAVAQETDDQKAITSIIERLENCEMSAEEHAAVEARLERNIEWLEEIDAEFARRPWLL